MPTAEWRTLNHDIFILTGNHLESGLKTHQGSEGILVAVNVHSRLR